MTKKMNNLKREILEHVGYAPEIINDRLMNEVEECIGRDGQLYLWYLDGDGWEACMRVSTEEYIDEDEILALLGCPDE